MLNSLDLICDASRSGGILAVCELRFKCAESRGYGLHRIACDYSVVAFALLAGHGIAASAALAQSQVAQTPAIERTGEVDRGIETIRQAQQLRSVDLGALDDGVDVTFAQVLSDPDNIELNIRFALTQIRQGNVRGAGATLERVLLIAPNIADVRILYAVVLFRLDNLDEAEREMRTVLELPLSPDLREQIDGYLAQIENRRKRTRFALSANLSYQFDWNRNSAARSEERLAFGIPTPLTGSSTRQDDLSTNGLVRLSFDHDLGAQARHTMLGSVSYFGGDQVQQDALDLQAVFVDWGYKLDFTPLTVTPQLLYKNMRLAREKYLTALGASTRAEYSFSTTLGGFAAGKIEQQAFHNVDGGVGATDQNGRNYQLLTGLTHIASPRHRLQLSLEHTRNSAQKRWESYHRDGVTIGHTWLLGSGAFLLSSLNANLDRYDGSDPFVSALTRRDNSLRVRATFGVPLGSLGEVPDGWSDISLTMTAEGYRQRSTITNYSYDNYRFSIGLGKVWEF